MTQLRKLKQSDAPLMFEWMHDEDVVHFMKADFQHKSLNDCERFIKSAQEDTKNIHLAATDDNDTYLGTVSLKNIWDGSAEFAITIRSSAMGTGMSKLAMEEIIDIGFEEKGLCSIYWCVSPENRRAVRFYDKNGYHRVKPDSLNIRGVQQRTAPRIPLVSHYKRRKEEENLRVERLLQQTSQTTDQRTKLNMDILFLHSAA